MNKVILMNLLIIETFAQANEFPRRASGSIKERLTFIEARLNQLESQLLTIKSCRCLERDLPATDKQKVSKVQDEPQ